MLIFDELRCTEFVRLGEHAYLDYTGSALYGVSQLWAHRELLERGIFGNPHSSHEPSLAATRIIEEARRRVLRFLGVDESTHSVIFTANTSAAIKLVAESFPFTAKSTCVLAQDNHNSVNGIREYARRAGARIRVLPLNDELRLRDVTLPKGSGLVAFPAQSNFSGVRHPLSLVSYARERGYAVLLDIAAYAPSHAVDLRETPADFAVLSFYKLFGYPTGLGALVARHESLERLRRPWFAGGTVTYASVAADTHRLRPYHDGFEDGTPDFLSIAALDAGFALLERIGMERLSAHVARLTSLLLDRLTELPHVRIYGPTDMHDRGGAVAFNVEGVPYPLVETRARDAGVSVRGGCFCNPGASEAAFGLTASAIAACLDSLGDDFTPERFATCAGTTIGAVRASVGMANNEEDVERAVEVVRYCAAPPTRILHTPRPWVAATR